MIPDGGANSLYAPFEFVHKKTLATAPVAKQPDGKRRLHVAGSEQVGKGINIGSYVEPVFAGRVVGSVGGNHLVFPLSEYLCNEVIQ